jgi:N-acyl-phosphatidylethanolamine-hydrolysing phospholipase D
MEFGLQTILKNHPIITSACILVSTMSIRRICNMLTGTRSTMVRFHSSTSTTTAAVTNGQETTKVRSAAQIQELVQKRVDERHSWDPEPSFRESLPGFLKFMRQQLFEFQPPTPEEFQKEFPIQTLNWEAIQNPLPATIQLTWLGHASVLIQLHGWNILCDPVLSDRCSPSQWFGPKRYQPAPCSIGELASQIDLDLILISHNHYDHLDYANVQELASNTNAAFCVPLGLREWFHKHVSKNLVIYEQDWHETCDLDKPHGTSQLSITAVPMSHWSNRTGDKNKTLWCGYAIQVGSQKVLFPGDTAWFEGLAQVGERYGPFHVAAIPIGAYEPREFMKTQHVNPEEAVRMKDAVQAKHALPIHWGTFPLTTEPVFEPREKLLELMKDRDDKGTFVPWLIGETKQFK